MGEVVDFTRHLAEKQSEKTKAWLAQEMDETLPDVYPMCSPAGPLNLIDPGDRPSDTEPDRA